VNVVLLQGMELKVLSPLCNFIICQDRLKPISVTFSFMLKNGMNILSAISSVMSGPVSVTLIKTLFSTLKLFKSFFLIFNLETE